MSQPSKVGKLVGAYIHLHLVQIHIIITIIIIIITIVIGGINWTLTSAPSTSWQSIASDSTGQYLVAVGGYIYTSSSGSW